MSNAYRVGLGGAGGLYLLGWGWPWGRGRRGGLERWDWGPVRLLYEEICFTAPCCGTIFLFMFRYAKCRFPLGGGGASFFEYKDSRG